MTHLWQGQPLTDEQAFSRLSDLDALTRQELATPLPARVVLDACAALSEQIARPDSPVRARLGFLDSATLDALVVSLSRSTLEGRLHRELGDRIDPARLRRPDAHRTAYEAWAPLGLLVHVAPGNAPAVGALSVVEGLLTGNMNVLKNARGQHESSVVILSALAEADPTGILARRIIVLSFSSRQRDWLAALCQHADGLAAWGGEEAIDALRDLAPAGCRVVAWGHRISFAYLTARAAREEATLDAVVADTCALNQQACSSPQVVYLDTQDFEEVADFSERLAARLHRASAALASAAPTETAGPAAPTEVERAEITTVQRVAELEQHLGLTRVYADAAGRWRVIADRRQALSASPLYRSLWVKPLPRERIVEVLYPMRRYLQTAAVAGTPPEVADLSQRLFTAGVTRVTSCGSMIEGYPGEPHDGLYPLQRYARRVSVHRTEQEYRTIAALSDLMPQPKPVRPQGLPLIGKEEVQRSLPHLPSRAAQLFFQSGGSSGAPALSLYTYRDYTDQMRAVADGLLAAGFDPATERVANLFVGGNMYGGFLSFFTALEHLGAAQLPIAMPADPNYAHIADMVIRHRATALFGMPSHLWRLLHERREEFLRYGGIRALYYGGEHLHPAQREVLREEFGIATIRSATYGSTDLGPLGYQCQHSTGSIHHIHSGLLDVEVIDLDHDEPVAPGKPGRLVFTSLVRTGQNLRRYEIGDIGRLLPEPCPCGSLLPRVELLGRYGDVIRVGSRSFHYQTFVDALARRCGYAGDVQVQVEWRGDREHIVVLIDATACSLSADTARCALIEAVPYLGLACKEGLMSVVVNIIHSSTFTRTASSQKIKRVIDRRCNKHRHR
ncbi:MULTISPECIES: acyl-CoA reductase [unclassified Corynebacterium]|uniref:acyl-CoA reductase n=1 Tax=unclassified Corynebacterium TaxID=2624378 RepID=UPI0029C9FC24|nr:MULTISPECIES: acyl-CoA reductase [unclassified Corynebacterium]WPF66852.1 acyl-CoA reductase [Corynebacterium sp. 22KM0430]WPF69340.1 acyl-CoA reductase [Corynebacterium sp. 21KM1197]